MQFRLNFEIPFYFNLQRRSISAYVPPKISKAGVAQLAAAIKKKFWRASAVKLVCKPDVIMPFAVAWRS